MAKNMERIEDRVGFDGYIVPGYSRWDCGKCGKEVRRYHGSGQYDVSCECGAQYSCTGQRFRDDWRGNESSWNDEVGDMEGFEIQQLRQEGEL